MNPRQSVLIAMFLSLAIFMVAQAHPANVNARLASIQQVPKA